MRSQKGDYRKHRFGGNNEATEENNRERVNRDDAATHSAKIIESEMQFWKPQRERRGKRQVQQRQRIHLSK